MKCPDCNGLCQVTCRTCGGKGFTSRLDAAYTHIMGLSISERYERHECYECSGAGMEICSRCKGSGKIPDQE